MIDVVLITIAGITSVIGIAISVYNLGYTKGFKAGYFEGYKDGGNYCIDRLNTVVENDAP